MSLAKLAARGRYAVASGNSANPGTFSPAEFHLHTASVANDITPY